MALFQLPVTTLQVVLSVDSILNRSPEYYNKNLLNNISYVFREKVFNVTCRIQTQHNPKGNNPEV